MTADFVVDASIAAVWFLPDENSDIADAAMDALSRKNACSPDLLLHEVRNILMTAERRKRIPIELVLASLVRLRQLPITISDSGDDALVVSLARKHQLSAYDAAYLALAITQAIPLATLDKKLRRAAEAEAVLPFGA
ncbi:type II toxin-antitoxin system VapC family toxin [Pararhizobium gei]|uniref:type II toxin-antitoxin system VapC family toxin n=1 Tax=Pararhizobium gei TaxID=1395951 RepID=UPI0023D9C0FF|nr:type II toxin-antitoxin system VapC family toxin [Rhizobium gei]